MITKDFRKYAAEQGIAEEAALVKGMEEKSKELVEKGAARALAWLEATRPQLTDSNAGQW